MKMAGKNLSSKISGMSKLFRHRQALNPTLPWPRSMAKIQPSHHHLGDNISDDFKLLRGIVAATCLRRTKKMISSEIVLPSLRQHVEMLDLNHSDHVLYNFFKRFSFMAANSSTRTNPLSLMSIMRLIATMVKPCYQQIAIPRGRIVTVEVWHCILLQRLVLTDVLAVAITSRILTPPRRF